MSNHVEHRIQSWLDGELSANEAEAVENHCRSCDGCGEIWQAQLEIRSMLRAGPAEEPLAPMWPAVEEKLHGKTEVSLPFAFGASAAAVAGIAIGVFLGTIGESSYENGEQDVWSEVGSTMTVESSPGLSGFYLDAEEGSDS
jgi:anti-sigma factor RsiW